MDNLLNPYNKFGKLLKIGYFIENNFEKLMNECNINMKENENTFLTKYNDDSNSNNNKEIPRKNNSIINMSLNDKYRYLMEEAERTCCDY